MVPQARYNRNKVAMNAATILGTGGAVMAIDQRNLPLFSLACFPAIRERRLWAVVWLCGGLLLTGCQSGEELGRISGKVSFAGKPLSRGLVMFANQEKGIYMTAPITQEGTYRVEMAKGSGLPLGDYQVAVAPPLLDHPIGPILNPPKVEDEPDFPPRYRTYDTSPLKVTIQRGDNEFNIDLQAPE